MTRAALHLLKGVGYLISTASVVLLAIVGWKSASDSYLLAACLEHVPFNPGHILRP